MRDELARIPTLRDLQVEQALDYPAINVDVNRQLAGQLGVTVDQVGRSFAAATSSSRFVAPNYWADPRTGIAFQVQVEIPQPRMTSLDDLRVVPVDGRPARRIRCSATSRGSRTARSSASTIASTDSGWSRCRRTSPARISAASPTRVDQAIARAGTPPRGATVRVRGQIAPMRETLHEHRRRPRRRGRRHLPAARREFPVAAARVRRRLDGAGRAARRRADAGGSRARRSTSQSFMGAIMAIGVAVANAILLVTFAEQRAAQRRSALDAAIDAARARMRPVLMTSAAMIAGMMPMALALGEGAEATAPLGRAVIGGLAAATLATLLVLPSVYPLVQQSASVGVARRSTPTIRRARTRAWTGRP